MSRRRRQAGYPAPVLQLLDELTLTLPQKIRKETRAAGTWTPAHLRGRDRPARGGRAHRQVRRGAIYEYADGKRVRLWPGLRTELGATNHDVDLHELGERMLFVEAIETQKCLDEGVLTSVADANIGSIFGIGFPAWTGGVVQYVEGLPRRSGGLRGARRRVRGEVRPALLGSGGPSGSCAENVAIATFFAHERGAPARWAGRRQRFAPTARRHGSSFRAEGQVGGRGDACQPATGLIIGRSSRTAGSPTSSLSGEFCPARPQPPDRHQRARGAGPRGERRARRRAGAGLVARCADNVITTPVYTDDLAR